MKWMDGLSVSWEFISSSNIQLGTLSDSLIRINCLANNFFCFTPRNRITWWRHQMETFSALLALYGGNPPVTGEFPHKGQNRGTLMFSLIYGWTKGWVNNRDAGDLTRHRAHYDVIVINCKYCTYCIALLYNFGIRGYNKKKMSEHNDETCIHTGLCIRIKTGHCFHTHVDWFFRLSNWFSLLCSVPWMDQLPNVSCSTFRFTSFNQKLLASLT